VVLSILVACDHRPSTAQQQPPATVVTADAAAGLAPVPTGDACTQIGVKIAEIIISATTDATQKAAYEQERTKMVKRFSENCTREAWSDAVKTCFLAAKNQQDIDACSRELAKANPPAPAPSAPPPAGSAAPSGSGLKRD